MSNDRPITLADGGNSISLGFALGEFKTTTVLHVKEHGEWIEHGELIIGDRPPQTMMELKGPAHAVLNPSPGQMMKWAIGIATTTLLTVVVSASIGEDEFVGLGGYVDVRDSSYSRASSGVPTAFVGEPVEVVLTVHNNTRQPLEIGRAGSHWLDTVLVDFRRNAAPSSDLSFRRASLGARNAVTTIGGGRSIRETVVVTRGNGQSLEPGSYHLTVTLPASSINRTGNDRLRAEIRFEVKTPTTSDEQVDYYLHLAYQAKRHEDLDAEQAALEKALQLHRASATAHADLGQLWRKRGDCTRSRAEFQRAIAIITSGGDPGLQVSLVSQEDWLSSLRAAVTSCP